MRIQYQTASQINGHMGNRISNHSACSLDNAMRMATLCMRDVIAADINYLCVRSMADNASAVNVEKIEYEKAEINSALFFKMYTM